MRRVETARLAGIAFHQPERLQHEHQLALADAASVPTDNATLLEYGERLALDLTYGGVLEDGHAPAPRQPEQPKQPGRPELP